MKQTSLAKLVFVMLVVACGSAAVLAWVYAITREPIKKAGEAKELEMLSLFSFNTSNTPLPTVPYPKIATLIIFFYSLPNIFR